MFKKCISALLACFILFGILPVSIKVKASSYNDLAQLPIMGWSSWSSIRKHPTEQKIKAAADVLAARFKRHGYEYVNLDDYYQLNWTYHVDKYGRWMVDPNKFPHGLKSLGNYIHKKGLKYGLYVTTGIPKGAIDQNTPIEGTPYHARDIVDLSKGQKVNFNFKNMYFIDYSKPGAQEYIDSWAKLFASYGVDYLKIDGIKTRDIPDIKAWAEAIKKTERPIHLELSNNLDIKHASTWRHLSNGWRTWHDVEAYGKPTTTDWDHVSLRFEQAAGWQPYAGPGGWNDLDSLNVANGLKDGLTKAEKRSYVSLWAIAASHFIIGSDLTKLDHYGTSLLTNDEIIGVNQSGVAGKRLLKTAAFQIFFQKLPDNSYNIGLFNTGTKSRKESINWSNLGIKGPCLVRDLWRHKDLGNFETGFSAKVAKHDTRMIHVIPESSLIVYPKSGSSEVNPSNLTLIWADQSGANRYHVMVATDPFFRNVISDQMLSSKYVHIRNLESNKKYYWKVSALKGEHETLIGIYSFKTKNAPRTSISPEVWD